MVRVMNSFGVMVRVGIRVYVKPFCSAAKPYKNQSQVKFWASKSAKAVNCTCSVFHFWILIFKATFVARCVTDINM